MDEDIIPLMLKDDAGKLHVISNIDKDIEEFTEGWQLVYLGKTFDVETIKNKEASKSKQT